MKSAIGFLIIACLFSSCKKQAETFPEESFMKLTVDGITYHYKGGEIGGTISRQFGTTPAFSMLYTSGQNSSNPSFFIDASAPNMIGDYLIGRCRYALNGLNGPWFNEPTVIKPEKRKYTITAVAESQLQWKGTFYVEVFDSTNVSKITQGEFAISIK